MVDVRKEFGKNLRKWRKERNLSQEDLAFRAETTAKTISTYESGNSVPGFNTILKLANALNITLAQLFVYDDKCLTIDNKELQYVLVEKFKNLPYEKRHLIYTIIDAIAQDNQNV